MTWFNKLQPVLSDSSGSYLLHIAQCLLPIAPTYSYMNFEGRRNYKATRRTAQTRPAHALLLAG